MNNSEKINPENEKPSESILDLNYIIYLQKIGRPITRKDIGERDIIIPQEAFEIIGSLEIVSSGGEIITIDLSDNQSDIPLVIKSNELGE